MGKSCWSPSRYRVTEPSVADAMCASAANHIGRFLENGNLIAAQNHASQWATDVSKDLGLARFVGWKFFKRNLAAKWFGAVERRRFEPNWRVEDVLAYADTLKPARVRMSLFPDHIACHAHTLLIPPDRHLTRKRFLERQDRSIAVEVFPESSGPGTFCFRRFTFAYGEDVFYEAAYGQAMNVFEKEQGQHPIAIAIKEGKAFRFGASSPPGLAARRSVPEGELRDFVNRRNKELELRSFSLCRKVGIDYLSIEGYFTVQDDKLVIVDVDLPFDRLFM